jgi:CysZ protein
MIRQPSSGPWAGLVAPWRALRLIAGNPKLWPAALAPFFINLGLFVLFFWFTYSRFEAWVRAFLPGGEGWWQQALMYAALVVVVLLLLAVEIYLFAVVGRIIAAPFLEILTRRVERLTLGGEPEFEDMGPWRGMLRAARQELKKLVLYLTLISSLLILNLIPVVGALAYMVLTGLTTCFFMALEFLDYPLERRGFSLGRKLAYVWELKLTGLGFGAMVLCLGVVPILNLAMLPLAAAGGALLFLDHPPREGGPD